MQVSSDFAQLPVSLFLIKSKLFIKALQLLYASLCEANRDEVYSGDSCVAAKLRIDLHARS